MTDGYTAPSDLPYTFEGDMVAKARVKFSGTTDLADVLHRGDRVVIVCVGEVTGINHAPNSNRLTRQQAVSLDAVYVVSDDDDDVDALVERLRTEAIRKADELEGRAPLPFTQEDLDAVGAPIGDPDEDSEWDDEDDDLVDEAQATVDA